MSDRESRNRAEAAYVAYLRSLAERAKPAEDEERGNRGDSGARATLAMLRRGLGKPPGQATELFPIVIPLLPPDPDPWTEARWFALGALFALHPHDWPADGAARRRSERNLGASLRVLRGRLAEGGGSPEALDRRVGALLAADADDLWTHLRHLVGRFGTVSQPVRVDYRQLLRDSEQWGAPDRPVQLRWARAYWRDPDSRASPDNAPADDAVPEAEPHAE